MTEETTEGGRVLSPSEAAEFGEFCRARRETELRLTLSRLLIDASRRETDDVLLQKCCETAVRLHAAGVTVSPVHVAAARRLLKGKGLTVACVAGGTGESLMSIKKAEAKHAVRQGATQIRLVLCYSKLAGGSYSYLKREIRRVRRAVKRGTLVVSLEDRSLGGEEIALGVRAAVAGRADAVCVHGETELVLRAVQAGGERLQVEASGVENAQQLRLLVKAGAVRAVTAAGEQLAEELYTDLNG